jgi:hypothetical protein
MPNNNPLPKKKFKHNPFDTKGKGIHTYEPIGFVTDEGEILINEETVWIPTCYGGKQLDEKELTYALMSNASYDFFMRLLGMKIGTGAPHRNCPDCAVINSQDWLDMSDYMTLEEIFQQVDEQNPKDLDDWSMDEED